ncbi:MAG TPA: hypothetical protein VE422_43680 [Terriglobia bacterium]|nr:hypothetical protein [Terriglobia bacterium]
MLIRIAAITFIFFCTSVAWFILGATVEHRSSAPVEDLKNKVANTWGAPHEQKPPTACYVERVTRIEKSTENGKAVERYVEEDVCRLLPLDNSRIVVDLDLEHRQKGLLWFSTYKVQFAGTYTFTNTTGREQRVEVTFPYPASQATYDGLQFTIDNAPVPNLDASGTIKGNKIVAPGQSVAVLVSYQSQGLDRWAYNFAGQPAHVRGFNLDMTTNFKAIDFPENTLSPTNREETQEGWRLNWNYSSLLTSYSIAMHMPEKLQPGPLAGQISFFAPVSLFFFFFLIFIITTMRNIDLHPMNYFFLAAAFFAFHLLLAYLVDHVSIHLSFVICSLVSIFLVISYLRLVVNMRFALLEAGGAQFVYLVLFSYAFFFAGFTGLAVTIGAIVTLFVVMQITARLSWAEKFSRRQIGY